MPGDKATEPGGPEYRRLPKILEPMWEWWGEYRFPPDLEAMVQDYLVYWAEEEADADGMVGAMINAIEVVDEDLIEDQLVNAGRPEMLMSCHFIPYFCLHSSCTNKCTNAVEQKAYFAGG